MFLISILPHKRVSNACSTILDDGQLQEYDVLMVKAQMGNNRTGMSIIIGEHYAK